MILDLISQTSSRHTFDPSSIGELAQSQWLSHASSAGAGKYELIKSTAKAWSRGVLSDAVVLFIDDTARVTGESVGSGQIRVHPVGALVFLTQPLNLLVEDELSDGAFVLWMARLLGFDQIRIAYREGHLRFRHAGGKDQLARSARSLSFGIWPRDGKPIISLKLRAAVLLDSDSRFPGDHPNAKITIEASEHVAFVHVLLRRTIENYIPLQHIRRRLKGDSDTADVAAAYERLTEQQQCHYPTKRGFHTRTAPIRPQTFEEFVSDDERPIEERDLYRATEARDWEPLSRGFGNRLASIYIEPAHRCEPNEHVDGWISPRTELRELLTKIVRHL